MSSNNISALFSIINKAKDLGSYSIANLAFSCLIDLAMDLEDELHFIWEKSKGNDDEELYYDLLTISDGIRSACIPAPLLKKPLAFRSICKKEVEREEHNRPVKEWVLKIISFDVETENLTQQILDIFPHALEKKREYLASSRKIHDEKKEFEKKFEIARQTTFARVEATGEIRSIHISPELGYLKFSEIPWDSHNYTIGGSINNPQWVVKSDGDPQWIWYYVHSQLPTLKKGESRWLIGKGCDASSYYEVWVIPDINAIPKPIKNFQVVENSFWVSTTLDEYKPSKNYIYSDTGRVLKDYWGSSQAIKFADIPKTSDVIIFLPSQNGDIYYDRWLVWNKIAKRYDMLRPAQY